MTILSQVGQVGLKKIRTHETSWFFVPQKLPSGEHTKSNGKSPFLMGKSTINSHFPLLC